MSGAAAVLPDDKLKCLIDQHLFTVEEIARACGVAANTVYARRQKPARRRTAFDDRLDDLYFLIHEMREFGLDQRIARGWCLSRSAHLDGHIPADLIGCGRFNEVRAAGQAFMRGELASEYRGNDVGAVRHEIENNSVTSLLDRRESA